MTNQPSFKINLTDEQKKVIRAATGKDAEALELTAQELEERIAPMRAMPKFGP